MAETAPICDFGWQPPGFALPDTAGRVWTLDALRGNRGTLVAFICNHCPYVIAIADRLVRDANDLAVLGVNTVAICSNDPVAYPADAPDRMADFAKAHGFPFPYLHDADQSVARGWGAVCTPDFFGYNADLKLQYRGRLDESRKETAPEGVRRDLFEAMKQVAQTGHGPKEQIPSMGCSIKWKA
jgi:peroxiredoxin